MLARDPGATKKYDGFSKRQADHIRIGAVDELYENFRAPLDRVTAGLAHALAACQVRIDFGPAQSSKSHARLHRPKGRLGALPCERDRGDDAMPPPGKDRQSRAHLVVRSSLRQDATAAGHPGIGPQNEGIFTTELF